MSDRSDELVLVPSAMELELLGLAGVTVARCGVGPIVAAVETTRRLAVSRPAHVWLVGLAGTRDPARAAPGAVVVAHAVRDEAVGAGHGERFLDLVQMGLAGPDQPPPDELPPELPLHVPALDPPAAGADAPVVGLVGTVAATSRDRDEAAARARLHPDVLVEEMEGYAVAVACARAGVPLVILRGVANVAGDRDTRHWCAREAGAALRAVLEPALAAAREAGHGSRP